jgi:methyl-accepting chemotaxis protein
VLSNPILKSEHKPVAHPKIKTVLIGSYVLIGLMFAGFAWVTTAGTSQMNEELGQVITNRLPKVVAAQDIRNAFTRLNFAFARCVIAKTPAEVKAAFQFMAERQKDLSDTIEAVRPSIVTPKGKELLANVENAIANYQKVGSKITTLSDENAASESARILNEELLPQIELVRPPIIAMIAYNLSKVDDAYRDSEAAFARTTMISYGATGLIFFVLSAIGIYAIAGIAKPVQTITAAMKVLAAGNSAPSIPYAGRSDEIGAMAASVEVFRQASIDNRRLTDEAEEKRLSNEAEHAQMRAAAASETRRKLVDATGALAAGLKRLAAGDLDCQITNAVSEDFTILCSDFNAAVSQLSETMWSVSAAAGAIDIGTREIASSADDLSRRTEHQAGSLEETAAALDRITANVASSSRRAEEARQVATQANDSARKSGEVVAEAVDAMSRIETSSRQISNIIGVIDEIAFQTNLLALNAGVEAARAGDAGRGFAVVAQEVRELAQRSAKAAKEIKDLIQHSAVEVESGVRLVSGTGLALKTIEGHIVTINEHMNAIATSAREQSSGLSEVNTAINQMDQVTQQNAAMVEESNAASMTLAAESEKLRELIAHFKLARASSATSLTDVNDHPPQRRPAGVQRRALVGATSR